MQPDFDKGSKDVRTKKQLEIMKKLFVMAALVLSSVGAFAQYQGGEFTIQPKVGLNAASTTSDDAEFKAVSLVALKVSIISTSSLA